MKLEFLDRFLKNTQTSNFVKIRPVGDQLFQADGWTDRFISKLKVAFRNFATALKNEWTAVLQFGVDKCSNFNSLTDLDYKIYEGKAQK
jgi:hypothetical protein